MNPYQTGSLPTPSCFYTSRFFQILLVLLLGFLIAAWRCCSADVLCVDPHANVKGRGTGECWADPFLDLEDALTLARQDTKIKAIWLANGIYRPSKTYSPLDTQGIESLAGAIKNESFNPGKTAGGLLKHYSHHQDEFNSRLKTFQLVNQVDLIGGFEGQPISISKPNKSKIQKTILDGDQQGNGKLHDNSWHVLVAGNDLTLQGVNLELRNLTVRNGYAVDAPYFPTNFPLRKNQQPRHYHDDGAGLYVFAQSNIKLVNVRFENNHAISGGAIFVHDGSKLVLEECEFANNKAIEGHDITIRGGGPNILLNPEPLTEVTWVGSPNKLDRRSIFVADNYLAWKHKARASIRFVSKKEHAPSGL